ncbi:MAG: peptidase domain-containing ABC transporter [Sneathiella sp.]
MPKQKSWFSSVSSKVRPLFLELVVYSFFINILALVIPLFVLQVYNRVVAFGNISTLQGLIAGVLIALLFDFLLRQIRSRLLQKAAMRIDISLGETVMKKFWALPLRIMESRPGVYWQGVFRDVDTVRNTIAGPPFLLLIDLPFAGIFIVLIFIIAEPIAWVFVSIVPVFILLALISGKLVGRASADEKKDQRSRDSLVGDMINSRGTVKALSLDAGIAPYWEHVQSTNIESAMKRGMTHDGFINLGTVFTLGTTAIITTFGALAIIDQQLSIGALIAANMLSNRVIGPFSQLVGAWKNFTAYKQSRDRLDEVMNLSVERTAQTIQLDRPTGTLVLEKVSFKYTEDGEFVLENLSANFASNAVHMIMGPNGGGKSTLIKLMKGLYIADQGRILIDGGDITQFTRKQLTAWIGYVPQETVLIDGTIKENISGKRDYITDEEVVAVCTKVGIHKTITDFPDGYATNVGEAGRSLSGGVRQRIAIARALIGEPPILIFDEPSASLDRFAEIQLKGLLQALSESCTIIVVSHSPVLLGVTSYLHLLDKKNIIISGPKDEVLQALEKRPKNEAPVEKGDVNGSARVGA